MKAVFSPEITLQGIGLNSKNTFAEYLGLKFVEIGPDFLVGEMVVDGRHLRPGNIMNGGVSLALIETVGSVAARCALYHQGKNSLGIQVNANHLQMAKPGDRLRITAKAVHLGRTTHIWDVDIANQQSKLVSSGRITLLVVAESALGAS